MILILDSLPTLSKESWWILFGFLGLVIGLLPNERVLYLKNVLFVVCLLWIFVYIQFRLKQTILEVFIKYSLPQFLVFISLYLLSNYLKKNQNNIEKLNYKSKIEKELFEEIVKTYIKISPSLTKSNYEIIKGKKHLEERDYLFKRVKKSLVITSGWVSDYVVNENFIMNLQLLINKGVEIRLVYGYKDSKGVNNSSRKSINKLEELIKNNNEKSIKVIIKPNHSKILIVDNEYGICGSFNWLSNSLISNEEISFKTYDKEVIKDLNLNIKNLVKG